MKKNTYGFTNMREKSGYNVLCNKSIREALEIQFWEELWSLILHPVKLEQPEIKKNNLKSNISNFIGSYLINQSNQLILMWINKKSMLMAWKYALKYQEKYIDKAFISKQCYSKNTNP